MDPMDPMDQLLSNGILPVHWIQWTKYPVHWKITCQLDPMEK